MFFERFSIFLCHRCVSICSTPCSIFQSVCDKYEVIPYLPLWNYWCKYIWNGTTTNTRAYTAIADDSIVISSSKKRQSNINWSCMLYVRFGLFPLPHLRVFCVRMDVCICVCKRMQHEAIHCRRLVGNLENVRSLRTISIFLSMVYAWINLRLYVSQSACLCVRVCIVWRNFLSWQRQPYILQFTI